MSTKLILGLVVLAIGILLLGFGFNAADAPADKITETLTGRYSDKTMWYFILGTGAVILGGLVFLFGRRST